MHRKVFFGMPPCASRSHREQRGKIELKVVRHTGITVSMDAPLASIMSIGGGCKLFWVNVAGGPTGLAAILSDMRGDFLL